MNEMPDLRGGSVHVRRFIDEDIDDSYLAWLTDPAVTRYSNQRFRRHDRKSASAYLASFAGTANFFLSVRSTADDRAIGTMTAYVAPHHGTADIGILIGDRSVWGRGFGQEAWDLLVGWLLSRPGMRKITCGTASSNLAMIRLAQRSGMILEARRRDQEIIDGVPADILYFARVRDR